MAQLKSNYPLQSIPFNEYPRPQLQRKSWQNLNGIWQFAKVKQGNEPTRYENILVPYSPETFSSGIKSGFVLQKGEKLVYLRKFHLDFEENKTVLLHFGAVDSHCQVFLNGQKAGEHDCGYTAFTLDITPFVKNGENEIRVDVTDEFEHGAKGKQSKKRGGIWYTAQSGIWQTVWLEIVCANYIRNLKYNILFDKKAVEISAYSNGLEQSLHIFDGTREVARATFVQKTLITFDFIPWTPENPKLYTVLITNANGDEVRSYFGFRSFGIGKDKRGKARLLLNGKPYFYSGVLDQGYWCEGWLTPPSDLAMFHELTLLKKMGFNTVRKHIKIEPMRWYYHCDKLGLVVWQDFVNGGAEYKFTHIAALPFLGFHHRDDDYKYFARENAQGRREFMQMADDTVEQLYNCTCIGMWVIFNEGWGQFDSATFAARLKKTDPSRIIDSVSGWHDQGVGKTTLKSLHTYYTRLKVPTDPRPVILSEFGGYSLKCKGHVLDERKNFGYKKFKTKQAYNTALEKLFRKKLKPLIKQGLCGSIYTQVSDVEEETNGLVTYDRKITKADEKLLKTLNQELYAEMKK